MDKFILTLFLGMFSVVSFACTPGVGGGPSGDPHCMAHILANDPYYNGSINSGQTGRTITVNIPSKYGALAVNVKTGVTGGALNMNSKAEAKRAAIKQCEQGGKNAPCHVAIWVRNGCIALAEGITEKKSEIFYSSNDKGKAENEALNKCNRKGYLNCKIIIPEACSLP